MSLLKNTKYTLSANIVNQISYMIIFLVVPNILSKSDYGQIVFITVLLSFLVLSDFGMSFVYGRKMPSVYHSTDLNKIESYNQTFFWFSFTASIIGSIVISVIYFMKYSNLLNSFFLLFVNPLTMIVTFFISQYTVREDFRIYKSTNIKNSIARLLAVFFAYILGLSGWILGQVVASLIVLKSIKDNLIFGRQKFDISIIKSHLIEGLILVANFFFWTQLLNSGRLFASMYFSDEVIAQYGLTNAGYSLLLSLAISIFLPVTVSSLKIIQIDTKSAIEQLFSVIVKTSFLISLVTIISIEVSPYLYQFFFPKYMIDFDILKYQLLSLMVLPLVATLGNVFVGLQHPMQLMIINGVSFLLSYSVFVLLGKRSIDAAMAQCVGVNFLGFLLLFSVIFFYGKHIENKYRKTLGLLGVIFMPYVLYFLIRSLI